MEAEFEQLVKEYGEQERPSKEVELEDEVSKE